MAPRRNFVPVTIENLRAYLRYEPDTGLMFWVKNKGVRPQIGQVAGRKNSRGYITIQFSGKELNAHRVAWALHYGCWPELDLDHANLDKTDNRIGNLRLATPSQNSANRLGSRDGPKGIVYVARKRRWRAGIGKDGVRHFLGTFKTPEAAGAAYAEAAVRLFGEFARWE